MSLPPVTAVVPTHERPELMRRAVQSILDQEYAGDVEVVVVFDACEPVLPAVDLRARRALRGVVNERSRGLAGARNTGILAARHELVAFLDDDDVWLPGKLATQVGAIRSNPEAALVGTAMVVDDGTREHERLVGSDWVTHDMLLHDRLAGLHSSSFLFRRSALLDEIGLIDEELPRSYGEDYDILLRTSELGAVHVVDRPFVRVTWQGQSYFFGRWNDYADALEYLLAKHPAFGRSDRAIARIESQIAFARASAARQRDGARWARRSLRHSPTQVKSYLALLIAARLVTPRQVTRVAARFGKGI
ncbi:glycosyltransferase family 2 protein [Agromyces sp. Marseille-P2726]|uniref:glycosyltransferase family 2 protein n=1 Tax=Agromyces sp. Marseille-P2726 TaxID=2709132 RepID=UPI00156E0AB9|nr:glycosyltransferase family 2 protein [Agromyces sp. Marseille-P2726]